MSKHRCQPTSFRVYMSAGEGERLRFIGEQVLGGEPEGGRLITTGIPLDKEKHLADHKPGNNHLTQGDCWK